MNNLTVSIVLYHSDINEVKEVINLINKSALKVKIYLIDNSNTDALRSLDELENVEYIFNNKNLGYGAGHNIAIFKGQHFAPYHLIINSDIKFNPVILDQAFNLMECNPEVGLISPRILSPSGELQYFCRKLPTPFDLLARRFIPQAFKTFFQNQLDQYILLDADYSQPMIIPNLPGCFMFIRSEILIKVGGFDDNFFMYVEDVDLTRRILEHAITLYYPKICITHYLARGSYKWSKLALYHIGSAIYYFNKWGWLDDEKRDVINKNLLMNMPSLTFHNSSYHINEFMPNSLVIKGN